MSGIFDRLPDLTSLEELRGVVGADLQAALDAMPRTPAGVLGSLPEDLDTLLNAVPGDPAGLVQPLAAVFGNVRIATEANPAQHVSAVGQGLTQIRTDLVNSALGELVFAPGEVRDLREVLLEQVPDLTARFLSAFTEMRDAVVPAGTVQEIVDFAATISAFRAELPTEPEELADFLARSFVGLPVSLLAPPLGVATPLLDRLEGLADGAANNDVLPRIQILVAQLDSAASVVGDIDVSVESSYRAAIDGLTAARSSLTAVQGGVQGAIESLNDGLDGIDLPRFETDLRAAIEGIPTPEVNSLDDIKAGVLVPLERVNRSMASLDPQEFVDRLRTLLQLFVEGQEELALGSWQADVLGFFEEIRASIEQLDPAGVRTRIDSTFRSIEEEISGLGDDFKQTLTDTLNEVLGAVENAVDAVDPAGVTAFIDETFGQVNAALDNVSFAPLQDGVDSALGTLNGAVAELVDQTTGIAGQLDAIVSSLEDVQFDPVTSEVIAEIEDVTEKLRQIDPASLSPAQRIALTAAVGVLQALDFEEAVTTFLTQRCNELAALPREPLQTVASRLDALFERVAAFDPMLIVAPLDEMYGRLLQPVENLQAGTLLQPLDDALSHAREAFDALSPAQLKAPLDELYAPLPAALDALSPAALLQPVTEVFDGFEEAVQRVNLTALFHELENLLEGVFAQARAEIIAHIQGLGLPAPITDLLTSLAPLVDLASPAFFTDPAGRFVEIMDAVMSDFRPGDLFVPLQRLYDELMALLDQVEEEVLVGGFEQVRQTLVTALKQVDPAALTGRIENLSIETSVFYAALNPASLLTALDAPYRSLSGAFDSLDGDAVPAELQGLYDQVESLVASTDPEPVLASLQDAYNGARDRLDGLGGVSLDGLDATFAPIRQQIGALVPDFLREPVTVEGLAESLAALRPDAVAAEVDAAFAEFRDRFAALRPLLVAELESFADERQDLFALFDLPGLGAKFQETYDAITSQVSAIDPAEIIADLQGTLDTLKARVDELDPAFLVDELTETFDRIRGKLDALGLDAVETNLETSLQNVRDKLAPLDPVEILREAGLLETFGELGEALAGISVADAVARLDQALQKVCAELESELEKTQAAFEKMIAAIPAQIGTGVSL